MMTLPVAITCDGSLLTSALESEDGDHRSTTLPLWHQWSVPNAFSLPIASLQGTVLFAWSQEDWLLLGPHSLSSGAYPRGLHDFFHVLF